MNRFSDFQATPTSRQPIAIAVVEGRQHDVSNLCLLTTAPFTKDKPPPNSYDQISGPRRLQEEDSRPHRVRPRKPIRRIYPDTHALPDIPVAALIFNKIDATHLSKPNHHMTHCHQDPVANDDNNDHEDSLVPPSNDEQFDRPLIEISPGYRVELRGSDETWSALQRGFTKQLQCPCCSEQLFVIRDASMVLCPECRMIVPISDSGNGMGLGVRVNSSDECLAKHQQQQQQVLRTKSATYAIKDPPKRHDSLKDSNHPIQKQRTLTTMVGPKSVSRERSISPRVLTRQNF